LLSNARKDRNDFFDKQLKKYGGKQQNSNEISPSPTKKPAEKTGTRKSSPKTNKLPKRAESQKFVTLDESSLLSLEVYLLYIHTYDTTWAYESFDISKVIGRFSLYSDFCSKKALYIDFSCYKTSL